MLENFAISESDEICAAEVAGPLRPELVLVANPPAQTTKSTMTWGLATHLDVNMPRWPQESWLHGRPSTYRSPEWATSDDDIELRRASNSQRRNSRR